MISPDAEKPRYIGHRPATCCDRGYYDGGKGWWCCDRSSSDAEKLVERLYGELATARRLYLHWTQAGRPGDAVIFEKDFSRVIAGYERAVDCVSSLSSSLAEARETIARYETALRFYAETAPCVVCGADTIMACSDCAIDAGGKQSVHVCEKTACRDAHEKVRHHGSEDSESWTP